MNHRSPPRSSNRPSAAPGRKRCGVRNFVASLHVLVLLLLAGVVGSGVVGCSGDEEHPPLGGFGGEGGQGSLVCHDGQRQDCGYTMDRGDGFIVCYRGTQSCEDGVWSACQDGTITKEPERDTEGLRGHYSRFKPTALSTPASCMDLCDPSCMLFDENPPDITPDPGGTIDTIPDWSAPGGLICDHALCSTGTALDPACSPCVQTVCALDMACCSTTWNAACVNLVALHCGPPPIPPPSICDYTLFSETTISGGNNDGIMLGGPIGAGQTSGTAITLGNVTVDRIVSAGSVSLDNTEVKYTASWNGTLACMNSPTVAGVVCPTGSTTTGGTPYPPNTPASGALPVIPEHAVTCIATTGTTSLNSGDPTLAVTAGTAGASQLINLNSNTKVVLTTPGSYYGVNFNGDGTLVFAQPGTYTFNIMNIGANQPRILMPPSGRVNIDVCSQLDFGNGAEVYKYTGTCASTTWTCAATTTRPSPADVIWYTKDCEGGEVKVGPGAIASGILVAPFCKVHLYSGNGTGSVAGLVYATSIQLEPGVKIDATGLVGDVCKATGVGGSTTPVCTYDATVPAMPPPFNEPCESGLDCQVNSHCTNVDTDNACSHSKCIEGALLPQACRDMDPCVDRICAAEPACCTTAWTASCVNRVKSTCDSWCGPKTGCAHSACTAGSTLTQGCDPSAAAGNCTQTVCSDPMFAACCTTGWTSACASRAKSVCSGTPSGSINRCNYAVLGSVVSLVNGTNLTGGSLQVNGPVPSQTCTASAGTTTVSVNGTLPLASTGNVTIATNIQATLVAGTYTLQTLTLGSGAQLRLPASGNVIINVCGNVSFGNGSRILTSSGATFTGANLLRLRINTNGNITLAAGAQTRGVFLARGTTSSITLTGGNGTSGTAPEHHGVLWANGTVARSGSPLTNINNSIPVTDCQTSVTSMFANLPDCPVTTPPAVVTAEDGSCLLNDEGFTDATCAGQDLSVEFACDNDISVCNHGNVAAAAGATLRFYPRDGHQFATTTPDTTWSVGTCTVTSAIAAGACVTQTCPAALFDEDLTIQVSASGAECSTLDNWSMYQDGAMCLSIGGGGEEVVTEVYTATCPDQMAARWDQLGWRSSVPGASIIEWSGRGADTAAALGAETFEDLGVAQDMPDTQNCPINGSCAAEIGTELWPDRVNHPPVLEIEARLVGSGMDVPTLQDWKVTYTCVYDQ